MTEHTKRAALGDVRTYATVERDVRDKLDRLVIDAKAAGASWRELADALGLGRSGAEARHQAAERRQTRGEEPMSTTTDTRAREARLRRRLQREGQRLTKVREGSRAYAQYGPYTVLDQQTDTVVAYGCTLDGLEAELDQEDQ